MSDLEETAETGVFLTSEEEEDSRASYKRR